MEAVGRDDQQPGVAAGQEVVVEPVAVDLHVGQEPAVAVPALAVEAEPDRPALQAPAGEGGGLRPEAAHRAVRVDGLGRVDPEQADPLPPARPGHVDGVPVDHGHHPGRCRACGAARRTEAPPAQRGGGQRGHEYRRSPIAEGEAGEAPQIAEGEAGEAPKHRRRMVPGCLPRARGIFR